ncbi:hypothetical protein JYU34_021952 [Plutella xylostella]|uniref:Endonuclease/exonuclease/phosphatase domain-containing protein n=1 Tax=Plutella xylostella TaxID=51655 RepID=A0ABQ7PSA8_PLUXY|nr:hypothetical protein JYU34_021952 [Plutella xylostella]
MHSTTINKCKLVSFNCKSVVRATDYVKELCKNNDIIALQETWLMPHDLEYLSSIEPEFAATGSSAVDTAAGVVRGRPYGGVALLWRKGAFDNVCIVNCKNTRIVAINCKVNGLSVLVFSVYMPTDSIKNLPEFTECLAEVSAIIDDLKIENVFVLGDFNSHPGELFCNELLRFCSEQKWICADFEYLGLDSGTYTFISDAHGCTRWLDHCLTSTVAYKSISSIEVKYDVSWSDHFPLQIACDFSILAPSSNVSNVLRNSVLWGERDKSQIDEYHNISHSELRLIDFPSEMSNCCGKMCNNTEHKKVIDKMYKNIVMIMQKAALHCSKIRICSRKKYVIGWNKHVSEAHREARLAFQTWQLYGQPSSGYIT